MHGAHDRAGVPAHRVGIEVEAALAFGTGHHGTTRGCLLALDALLKRDLRFDRPRLHGPGRQGARILDIGTGTGVLAIAAAKALRARVLASDIDRSAVDVARANARLNGVGALVEVVHAGGLSARRLRERAPFDLVFANILLPPLKRLAAPIARVLAPGAHVVLSGLLAAQAPAALAAYGAQGLALEACIPLDEWVTVILKRNRRPAQRPRRPNCGWQAKRLASPLHTGRGAMIKLGCVFALLAVAVAASSPAGAAGALAVGSTSDVVQGRHRGRDLDQLRHRRGGALGGAQALPRVQARPQGGGDVPIGRNLQRRMLCGLLRPEGGHARAPAGRSRPPRRWRRSGRLKTARRPRAQPDATFAGSKNRNVTKSDVMRRVPLSLILTEHDLFRKPVPTFRDHALEHVQALSLIGSSSLRAMSGAMYFSSQLHRINRCA